MQEAGQQAILASSRSPRGSENSSERESEASLLGLLWNQFRTMERMSQPRIGPQPSASAPSRRSVALNDQNKLAGGVPKDTPFQRLRRPDELNLTTEITASQFCAVNSVVAALTPSVAPTRRSRSGAITLSWLHDARQKPFIKRRSFVAIYIPATTETNCASFGSRLFARQAAMSRYSRLQSNFIPLSDGKP